MGAGTDKDEQVFGDDLLAGQAVAGDRVEEAKSLAQVLEVAVLGHRGQSEGTAHGGGAAGEVGDDLRRSEAQGGGSVVNLVNSFDHLDQVEGVGDIHLVAGGGRGQQFDERLGGGELAGGTFWAG